MQLTAFSWHGRLARVFSLRTTGILPVFLPLFLLFTVASAFAQPIPSIGSASTDVLVVGKTAEITLNGENIGDGTKVLVIGEKGVSIELPKPTTQPATTQPTTKPVEAAKIDP